VIFHGFLAHGRYPTVRYAAEVCLRNGFAVLSADWRGHGLSPGDRGYLPDRETLVRDAKALVQYAQSLYPNLREKCFLLGSSMGGTIALSVVTDAEATAKTSPPIPVAGVVLLSPMLQLNVSTPAQWALWTLSLLTPKWQVLPSSSTDAERQYRDPVKRYECETDEFSTPNNHTIRIGSAWTCVDLANTVQRRFESISISLLIMVADEDEIVNNQGSFDLFEKMPSKDKTLKRYPALHGLLCEPSPLFEQIQNDMAEWIQTRI
jgi:acylglycerol lipase